MTEKQTPVRPQGDDRRPAWRTKLLKLKKEQFNLRFQQATGQLENTSRVREVRRDIARVKTRAPRRSAPQAKA